MANPPQDSILPHLKATGVVRRITQRARDSAKSPPFGPHS
jgi:hypothetical protein